MYRINSNNGENEWSLDIELFSLELNKKSSIFYSIYKSFSYKKYGI